MATFPPYEHGNPAHVGRPVECPTCGHGIVVVTGGGLLGMMAMGAWEWFKAKRLHRRTLKALRTEAQNDQEADQ